MENLQFKTQNHDIDETQPPDIDKCQSRNGVAVSEEIALTDL